MPFFAEYDSIKCLLYDSEYLELMTRVPIEHTNIYEEFTWRHFVVKTSSGNSNAVTTDMSLEQTIQRSQKVQMRLEGKL